MATMTAQDRREQERMAYNAYLADCPSRKLLERISDKWVALVIAALDDAGSLRYSELSRQIAGVSEKMLTQTLRSLERDGLVSRRVTASVPVRVDYELTELGASLREPILAIKEWAERHMDLIEENRTRYDAANA